MGDQPQTLNRALLGSSGSLPLTLRTNFRMAQTSAGMSVSSVRASRVLNLVPHEKHFRRRYVPFDVALVSNTLDLRCSQSTL